VKKIDHIAICCTGKTSDSEKQKIIHQLTDGLPKIFLSCALDDITSPRQWQLIQKNFTKTRGKKNFIIDIQYESEINLFQIYHLLRQLAKMNGKTIKIITINFSSAKAEKPRKSENTESSGENKAATSDLIINKLKVEDSKVYIESGAFGAKLKITCKNFQKALEFITFAQTN
jgi:hypothetical protein